MSILWWGGSSETCCMSKMKAILRYFECTEMILRCSNHFVGQKISSVVSKCMRSPFLCGSDCHLATWPAGGFGFGKQRNCWFASVELWAHCNLGVVRSTPAENCLPPPDLRAGSEDVLARPRLLMYYPTDQTQDHRFITSNQTGVGPGCCSVLSCWVLFTFKGFAFYHRYLWSFVKVWQYADDGKACK